MDEAIITKADKVKHYSLISGFFSSDTQIQVYTAVSSGGHHIIQRLGQYHFDCRVTEPLQLVFEFRHSGDSYFA